MGTSRLNPRNTRKIARITGLDVIRAWSGGGYNLGFVTSDHVHGVFHKYDNTWELYEPMGRYNYHYTSCHDLFPGEEFDQETLTWTKKRQIDSSQGSGTPQNSITNQQQTSGTLTSDA